MKFLIATTGLLLAFGAAHAQSSVTISGLIDQNVGKDIGGTGLRVANGTVSRLGFFGKEDLGGGMSAFFALGARLNVDNGSIDRGLASTGNTFFADQSLVGIEGRFGRIALGRQFSQAAPSSQIMSDPWFWENVTNGFAMGTGLIGHVWYNNSITYNFTAGPVVLRAMVAERGAENAVWGAATSTPYNGGLRYSTGSLAVGIGHEKTGEGPAKWTTVDAAYEFAPVTMRGLLGRGTSATGEQVKTWHTSASFATGPGTLHVAYGEREAASAKTHAKFSIGYYHALSKRTSLYTNFAYDRQAPVEPRGYEVGIKHTF